jgi:hypothetical protein
MRSLNKLNPVKFDMKTPVRGANNTTRPSSIGTPQFPGSQNGASIESVREFIRDQKRAKGYTITADTGTTSTDIKLSGTARMLLGFSILLDPARVAANTLPESFALSINNEVIIDQTAPRFFSPEFCDDEFYFFPRPLSGTDEITTTIQNSLAATNVLIAFYYI